MPRHFLVSLPLAAMLALPAAADEITDTLQSALDAYETGDVQYALEELDYARSKLLHPARRPPSLSL